MTNENKEVKKEELDQVSGGTLSEFSDFATAGYSSNSDKFFAYIGAHAPVINETVVKRLVAELDSLGITANIDVGWKGTGIGSGKNTYSDRALGKNISHEEVLERFKSAGKWI